jgi:hypothetical protein
MGRSLTKDGAVGAPAQTEGKRWVLAGQDRHVIRDPIGRLRCPRMDRRATSGGSITTEIQGCQPTMTVENGTQWKPDAAGGDECAGNPNLLRSYFPLAG